MQEDKAKNEEPEKKEPKEWIQPGHIRIPEPGCKKCFGRGIEGTQAIVVDGKVMEYRERVCRCVAMVKMVRKKRHTPDGTEYLIYEIGINELVRSPLLRRLYRKMGDAQTKTLTLNEGQIVQYGILKEGAEK